MIFQKIILMIWCPRIIYRPYFCLSSVNLHHDLGFLNEVILWHWALFDHFDGHVMTALPFPILYHSKLTIAKFTDKCKLTGINLPTSWNEK